MTSHVSTDLETPSLSADTLGRRILSPVSLWDHTLRYGAFAWATLGIMALTFVLFRYVLYQVRIIFIPLAVALVITYLLNPLVARLERRGVRRGIAVGVIFAGFLAVAAAALAIVTPLVVVQLRGLFQNLPGYLQKAAKAYNDFATGHGFKYRLKFSSGDLVRLARDNRTVFTSLLGGVQSFVGSVLHVVVEVLVGIVLSVYLLVDLPKIQRGLTALIPEPRRAEIVDMGREVGRACGGFFRGQLLVATFVGVASAIGLSLVKLPFAALVGLTAGIFNLVPLIGPFIGAVPAVFIGLLSGHPVRALYAVIVLLVVQQIDNHLVSPTVMGRTVRLHPIVVMLSLLAGGAVAGVFGMLLVIPGVAAAKVVATHLMGDRPGRGQANT
jgi:predicted PurR-regulated permease PerM